MTATKSDSLVCIVCRKQIATGEDYLVRLRDGRPSTVHRHLCFPPGANQPTAAPTPTQGA